MAEQDQEAETAMLAVIEAEIAERQALADFLRRRLGLSGDAPSGAGVVPGVPSPGRSSSAPGQIRRDAFFGMKIPQAIKSFLDIMKSPQAPKAINDGLLAGGLLSNSANFYTTMWTALKRLEEAGDVVNTKNGYGLTSWYPSRPKGPEPKKPKKKKRNGGTAKTTAKAAAKDAPSPGGSPASKYRAFLAEQMKQGKSMAEAAEAWKVEKLIG